MSKICFAIGHGKSAKGGYDSGATHAGYHEFKIAREIGKYAQEYYNKHYNEHCDLMNYNGDLSLKQRIAKLQDNTYDLVAEFHLNAAGGQGTECYYHHKSERGKKLAQAVTDEISSTLGVKNRGAKIKLNAFRKDYFGIIRQTKPCAILIETVFIDSSDLETVKTADGQRKCGEAIARVVARVRGLTATEKPSEPKPTPKPTPKPEQSKPKPNFIEPVVWQNGSTKENAYSDNALKNKIGSLSRKEKADSFGKYDGKTLVVYDISSGHKKAGFVKYEGKNPKKVGEWGADYQNGSTPEDVYSATDLSDKIGSLDPYEKCKCLAKYKGRYLVCYKVNSTNTYKTGFVKYNGKVE